MRNRLRACLICEIMDAIEKAPYGGCEQFMLWKIVGGLMADWAYQHRGENRS